MCAEFEMEHQIKELEVFQALRSHSEELFSENHNRKPYWWFIASNKFRFNYSKKEWFETVSERKDISHAWKKFQTQRFNRQESKIDFKRFQAKIPSATSFYITS